MHLVKKINFINGYKISITFNDKKTKIVDIEPYLKKGVFLPLRDPDYFKLVQLSGNTLVWPNEADFCPDVLYEIGKETKEAETYPKALARLRKNTDSARARTTLKASSLKTRRSKKV